MFGLVTALLPMSHSFEFMYLFGLIGGIGAGVLDIVQTVWLIEMWDSKSGSVLQLSEFAYGLGITVGPLVVEPFLAGQSIFIKSYTIYESYILYIIHSMFSI